ncbi:uncharacterized protein LOC127436448 isoform X3 [Myxocyprinus asiaticus]|uniref:uncharacterized protein LOC127436448 isoform X3 n=1 Tax=Myxocyprinus asiaticus TaxID=70543 RepID=UPI0022218B87|nr:uncharacterized protein LOC127436448 isoform X3 [Myxocyprinus asiaticus]
MFTEEQETAIKNQLRMKQLYRVPFERNCDRVKKLRHDYVDRILEMDAHAIVHEYIYVDEVGFNLSKTRRRGRNVIGQRAIVNVSGQHGGNITKCAAITQNVSCTIMPHFAPITRITSYVFWLLFMICLFKVCRMKTRQDLSSSGIMSAFIAPIRSKTGLLLIPIFLLSTCFHIHHF